MRVTFEGGGAGRGPLSWGQLDIWVKMTELGQSLAMGGARPLPDGTSVQDVAAELRYLMSRYESMRTRLEPDGDGPPRQVVHGHGEIDLEIVDVGEPGSTPSATSASQPRPSESDPDPAEVAALEVDAEIAAPAEVAAPEVDAEIAAAAQVVAAEVDAEIAAAAQVVAAEVDAEIAAAEVAAAEVAAAAKVAAEVEARYLATPFDHVTDWPVRMAVVRAGGACRFAVLVMSHLVLDGAGAVLMMTETDARTTAPVQGHSALEQARRQALPTGVRQNAAALRHWDTHLRAIPDPAVAPSRDVRSPRHWIGVLHSTTLPTALRVAAQRAGSESAPALLAAFAVAFARVTGVTVVPLRLVSSNRFRAGLADVVCPVSQAGLCVIDTAGDFTAVVRRTQGAALAAYKHAYYHRLDLAAVIAAVVADRGPQFDLDVSINDRRLGGALQDVPRPERTEFAWVGTQDEPSSALFLNVDGSDEAMAITMYLDSHFLAPDDGEALLWAMESIAVEAAANDVLAADVAEVVSAADVAEIVAAADVAAAEVAPAEVVAAADVEERVVAPTSL